MGMYLYAHFSIPKPSLLWSYDWGVLVPYKRDGLGECDRSFYETNHFCWHIVCLGCIAIQTLLTR